MSAIIKAGVIGHPISHSLSPKLHNYWLKKYNINGEYKAYDVTPENLESFIRSMPEKGFAGCNVTIPHKEAVIPFLDEVDAFAKQVGAVNTIVVRGGKLYGSNTDVEGFAQNVVPHMKAKNKAVVLGAGGAANAIWKALGDIGFKEVVVTNRSENRIAEKKPLLDSYANSTGTDYTTNAWINRSNALVGADLLVNTASDSLMNEATSLVDLSALPGSAVVADISYKPLMTPLLKAAKARGNPIVDGLGMLLHQAVPGFEAWFATRPEVTQELRDYIIGL